MAKGIFRPGKSDPRYQKIVDTYTHAINSGILEAGHQLPTVRAYAAEHAISPGTIKHAYDILERMGYIEKVQGRGTFVSDIHKGQSESKKDRAMAAIDSFLDTMAELSFSPAETRIFLDLKLREREENAVTIRIGAVECSPETLFSMSSQVGAIPHVDVYEYLLYPILDSDDRFQPDMDLIVTSATHFEALAAKMPEDTRIIRLAVSVARPTLLQIARIPTQFRVGILTATPRFATIIQNSIEEFSDLDMPPETALFGDTAAVEAIATKSDQLILPDNYLHYCSQAEQTLLHSVQSAASPILYKYRVERGSLLALEDAVGDLVRRKR